MLKTIRIIPYDPRWPAEFRSIGQALRTVLGDLAVRLALTKLDEARLLDGPLHRELRLSGTSRRSLVKRAAVATAIPAVVSISAPSPAMATSHCVNPGMAPTGTGCNQDAQCCSGLCGSRQFSWQMGYCT